MSTADYLLSNVMRFKPGTDYFGPELELRITIKRILPTILTVLISALSVSLADPSNQAEQAVIVRF